MQPFTATLTAPHVKMASGTSLRANSFMTPTCFIRRSRAAPFRYIVSLAVSSVFGGRDVYDPMCQHVTDSTADRLARSHTFLGRSTYRGGNSNFMRVSGGAYLGELAVLARGLNVVYDKIFRSSRIG